VVSVGAVGDVGMSVLLLSLLVQLLSPAKKYTGRLCGQPKRKMYQSGSWYLGNLGCLPGTQGPRGFYLIEFKPNYSPTLESLNPT
jgi:hypothetical protein